MPPEDDVPSHTHSTTPPPKSVSVPPLNLAPWQSVAHPPPPALLAESPEDAPSAPPSVDVDVLLLEPLLQPRANEKVENKKNEWRGSVFMKGTIRERARPFCRCVRHACIFVRQPTTSVDAYTLGHAYLDPESDGEFRVHRDCRVCFPRGHPTSRAHRTPGFAHQSGSAITRVAIVAAIADVAIAFGSHGTLAR